MKRILGTTLLLTIVLAAYVFLQARPAENPPVATLTTDESAASRANPAPPSSGLPQAPSSGEGFSLRAIVDNITGVDSHPESMEARAQRIGPRTFEIIRAQISQLKAESMHQSLSKLSSLDLYHWPGPGNSVGSQVSFSGLPVTPGGTGSFDDTSTLRTVLSNRRFVKLLAELGMLPRSEQERLLRAELMSALKFYQPLFDVEFEKYVALQSTSGQQDVIIGVPRPLSDNPDGSPTHAGARLRLFALATLAGQLGLDGLAPELGKLVDEAIANRNMVDGLTDLSPLVLADAHRALSLYDRHVLGTAVLGVQGQLGQSLEGKLPAPVIWSTLNLTAYDALRSAFDSAGIGIPIDYELGTFTVRFPATLTEADMQALLAVFP